MFSQNFYGKHRTQHWTTVDFDGCQLVIDIGENFESRRWGNFTRCTERGDLQISNNAAERALRKAALGRKNFLFVGNERGGEAAAIYYSLIETAKANGINPSQCLLHALRELPKRKGSGLNDVKDLFPSVGPRVSSGYD
jgi:hypothetical protein